MVEALIPSLKWKGKVPQHSPRLPGAGEDGEGGLSGCCGGEGDTSQGEGPPRCTLSPQSVVSLRGE